MNASEEAAGPRTFLGRLGPDLARRVEQLGRPQEFDIGQVLSRQGAEADYVLLVRSGVVKITAVSVQGDEVILGFRGHGEILGEQSALHGSVRSGNVVGHHAGVAVKVSAAVFRQASFDHPQILLALLAVTGERLRQADLDRLAYISQGATHRTALTLLSWASQYGIATDDGIEIGLRPSQKELAQAVGASDKTIEGALKALRRDGLVRTGPVRTFVVPDLDRLQIWIEEQLAP